MRRIAPREMSVRRSVTEIVERNDVEFSRTTRFVDRAQDVSSDTAVTVNANLDRHVCLLMIRLAGSPEAVDPAKI